MGVSLRTGITLRVGIKFIIDTSDTTENGGLGGLEGMGILVIVYNSLGSFDESCELLHPHHPNLDKLQATLTPVFMTFVCCWTGFAWQEQVDRISVVSINKFPEWSLQLTDHVPWMESKEKLPSAEILTWIGVKIAYAHHHFTERDGLEPSRSRSL